MSSSFWLIIFFILLVIELITVGLVSLWFMAGSLVTFIVSYFTDNLFIQLPIFLVTSILFLIFTRPLINKYFRKNIIKTNVNKLIGEEGIVLEDVTKTNMGKVKVDGQIWSAINHEKGRIKKDEEIEVLAIEGVKLIVRKKDV